MHLLVGEKQISGQNNGIKIIYVSNEADHGDVSVPYALIILGVRWASSKAASIWLQSVVSLTHHFSYFHYYFLCSSIIRCYYLGVVYVGILAWE